MRYLEDSFQPRPNGPNVRVGRREQRGWGDLIGASAIVVDIHLECDRHALGELEALLMINVRLAEVEQVWMHDNLARLSRLNSLPGHFSFHVLRQGVWIVRNDEADALLPVETLDNPGGRLRPNSCSSN